MYEPAVGPLMLWMLSFEHAASRTPPSSAGMNRILVMAGLRLSDPDGFRVVVQLVAPNHFERAEVPHVFGVVARANALDDLAVVVRIENSRRSPSGVNLRTGRRIVVGVVIS